MLRAATHTRARVLTHAHAYAQTSVIFRTGDPAIKIDVRGDGGYVVAPGSIHGSGAPYEFIEAPTSITVLPVFDRAWLLPEQLSEARDSEELAGPREAAIEQRLKRVRAYLAQIPPAVEGQGGDTHTFSVACHLVLGFDLTDEDALEVLGPWNSRCKPPWSDAELRTLVRNARQYGTEEIGGLLHSKTPGVNFPLTEAGDAEYFAQLNRETVRFDHRQGRWLVCENVSGIWVPDPVEQLTQMSVEMMRDRQRAALTLDGDKKLQAIKWGINGESRKRLTSTLALVSALQADVATMYTSLQKYGLVP